MCMKKGYFPFSLLLFLSLYFDCFFLGFVQTVVTNVVSLKYPGKLKTDWIGAATHKMNHKICSHAYKESSSSILMKPWFSVTGNKKRQAGNLCVLLETKTDSSTAHQCSKAISLVYCQLCLFFFFHAELTTFTPSIEKMTGGAAAEQLQAFGCLWLAAGGRELLFTLVFIPGELGNLEAQSQVLSTASAPVVQKKPKRLEGLNL